MTRLDDMKDGPSIASVAALMGDPARANILTALMDGRALTVSELARTAGVTIQTTSGHLAKLDRAGLLVAEKRGRHRYFRLSGADIAVVLEGLMGLAQRTGAVRLRTGPREEAMRAARVCYDHLAGERGVAVMDHFLNDGLMTDAPEPVITERGQAFLLDLGIDVRVLAHGRRPVCLRCLDWSERRSHLGGALGARLLEWMIDKRWAKRTEGRVLAFSPAGTQAFTATFNPPN